MTQEISQAIVVDLSQSGAALGAGEDAGRGTLSLLVGMVLPGLVKLVSD